METITHNTITFDAGHQVVKGAIPHYMVTKDSRATVGVNCVEQMHFAHGKNFECRAMEVNWVRSTGALFNKTLRVSTEPAVTYFTN